MIRSGLVGLALTMPIIGCDGQKVTIENYSAEANQNTELASKDVVIEGIPTMPIYSSKSQAGRNRICFHVVKNDEFTNCYSQGLTDSQETSLKYSIATSYVEAAHEYKLPIKVSGKIIGSNVLIKTLEGKLGNKNFKVDFE